MDTTGSKVLAGLEVLRYCIERQNITDKELVSVSVDWQGVARAHIIAEGWNRLRVPTKERHWSGTDRIHHEGDLDGVLFSCNLPAPPLPPDISAEVCGAVRAEQHMNACAVNEEPPGPCDCGVFETQP